ncbi:MAG: UDP-glucose 4-epimerase [Actinomycetota bacterium]
MRALTRKPVAYLEGVDQVVGDLTGPMEVLSEACAGVDAVFHLAGANEVEAGADPDGTLASTVAGTRRIAEAAGAAGVPRLIYLSTVHVYGASMTEGAVLTEQSPTAPRHPYALARLASEHVAASVPDLEVVVFRLTNGVGAPVDASIRRWTLVANDLCRQAAVSGTVELKSHGLQWRDFVALRDVCRIVAASAEQAALAPGTYNLGAGSPMTIRSLAALVQDAYEARTGDRPPLTAPEPPDRSPTPYTVSVARLRDQGWTMESTVADAVDETAAFCLEHRNAL